MSRWFVGAIALVFLILVWVPVEGAWVANCFNNYDLGIYAQAIQRLSWQSLNPWLSVREVHLFNDHFDPVLFFVLPFKQFLPAGLLAIRVEMMAILAAAACPLWLARCGRISRPLGAIAAGIICLSPLTLDAAFYPSHPGTWSLAPLAWIMGFLLLRRHTAALLAFGVLLLCKEEYPFLGFAIGLALVGSGDRRAGLRFCVVAALWGLVVFALRPMVLGDSSMYTNAVSHGDGLRYLLTADGAVQLGWRLAQMILPVSVLFAAQPGWTKNWRSIAIPAVATFVLLGIRVAGGYLGNHRVAPLVITSVFVPLFWNPTWVPQPRRIVVAVLLLFGFAASDLRLGSHFWTHKPFKSHCPPSPARMAAIDQAGRLLRDLPSGAVLMEGNLIPRFVDLPDVAHIGATRRPLSDFRYLLVEKISSRNPWPLTAAQLDATETQWRLTPGVLPVIDNEWIVLLRK